MFVVAKFYGSYRNAKFDGYNLIRGKIIKDSYGKEKQQHTFTIEVKESVGTQTEPVGKNLRIKGRKLYNHFLLAKARDNDERKKSLEEKHQRGTIARMIRDERRKGV